MDVYEIRDMGNGIRCRWVYDTDYNTVGSYDCGTEEETRRAERAEIEAIERGKLVVLGCIVEKRCGECGEWRTLDSLWGIVIKPNAAELDAFARDSMDLPAA